MERSFGKRPRYFIVYRDDEPVALCPLVESAIRRWSSLASLPVGDVRHIAISPHADQEIYKLIMEKSIQLAKASRSACLILVNSSSEARDSISNACALMRKDALTFPVAKIPFLDLQKHNPKDIWDNVFDSKKSQRKYINRFEKAGYKIKEGRSSSDVDTFYKFYCENLNHIGGQVCDRSHIDILFEEFPENEIRLTLLQKDGEIAGGLIGFPYAPQKTMYLRYLAMSRNLPSTFHPPYALFWDAVNYAYDHGHRWVCFGSSSADPDVRSHQIKMSFGCDYREYPGQLIGRNPLFNVVYKSYIWSREAKERKASDGSVEAEAASENKIAP